jgi:hypothetical protein
VSTAEIDLMRASLLAQQNIPHGSFDPVDRGLALEETARFIMLTFALKTPKLMVEPALLWTSAAKRFGSGLS